MSKISELSDGGSLQSTDYLIAVRSGGNVKVQPNGTVTGTTGSFSGNVTFADNAKAIFGAGSDLQIYHDGLNSYVQDAGDGALILNTTNGGGVYVYSAGETMATFNSNGAVNLYYDNAAKLATTSTGIDVTGTVTADGGDFTGQVQFNGTAGVQLDNGAQAHTWTLDDNFTSRFNIGTSSASAAWVFGSNNANYWVVSPSGVVVNQDGADTDFRVESDTNTHLLFADAANNRVNIGTTDVSSQGTLAVNGSAIFGRSATTTGDLLSSGGGNNSTYNGVAIMSNSDQINAQANTALSSWIVDIGGRAADGVTFPVATADSFSVRRVAAGGAYVSAANYLQISSGGTVFNEDGADHDFRIESDNNTHMLFVNAGTDNVGINTSSPGATLDVAGGIRAIDTSGGAVATTRVSTNNQTDAITSCRTTDSNGTRTGFMANGYPDAPYAATIARDDTDFSAVGWQYYTLNSTYEAQTHAILKFENVAGTEYELINATFGEVVINEGSRSDIDFRVESDSNSHMLFVDAGNDSLYVGKNASSANVNGHELSQSGTYIAVCNFAGTNEQVIFNQRDGTGTTQIDFRNGSVARGYIEWTTSGTTYNSVSDRRMKENIADADDAGSLVDAIQVRKFDWINSGKHQPYGMIAQELISIAPDAVSGSEDSEKMMAVDYSRLVPMLIKEIQSLRARVAQLEGA